jgi:hypothetical protein
MINCDSAYLKSNLPAMKETVINLSNAVDDFLAADQLTCIGTTNRPYAAPLKPTALVVGRNAFV